MNQAKVLTHRTLGELRRCILRSIAASKVQCCSAATRWPHLRTSKHIEEDWHEYVVCFLNVTAQSSFPRVVLPDTDHTHAQDQVQLCM